MSVVAWVALLDWWKTERLVAWPPLETERLVLRQFKDDDLAAYFAMMDSPEILAALRTPDELWMPEASNTMASYLGQ